MATFKSLLDEIIAQQLKEWEALTPQEKELRERCKKEENELEKERNELENQKKIEDEEFRLKKIKASKDILEITLFFVGGSWLKVDMTRLEYDQLVTFIQHAFPNHEEYSPGFTRGQYNINMSHVMYVFISKEQKNE